VKATIEVARAGAVAKQNGAEMSTAAGGGLVSDLDIELWVHQVDGFVPHPFWISHCKEIYLDGDESPRPLRHEYPPGKRPMIRAALSHFGILRETRELAELCCVK
jgi:hypothetical protein